MYPCPFYSPTTSNHSNDHLYSSDSDIDSDSGYSSPLHKRTHVSSGTQPVEFIQSMVFTPKTVQSQQSMPNSIQSVHRQNISNFDTSQQHISSSGWSGQRISNSDQSGDSKSNSTQSGKRQIIFENSVQSEQSDSVTAAAAPQQKMSYAMIAQRRVVPSPKPSVQQQSPKACDKTNICESDIKHSRNHLSREINSGANKFVHSNLRTSENDEESKNKENINDTEASTGEKKKRKRNRKRPRKNKNDDSEISHTTEDVELHFEDEEEFPDLGSAQIISSNKRSQSRERTLSSAKERTPSSTRERTPSREINDFVDEHDVGLSIHNNDAVASGLASSVPFMNNSREGSFINNSREITRNPTVYPTPVAMTAPVSVVGPLSYSSILKAVSRL